MKSSLLNKTLKLLSCLFIAIWVMVIIISIYKCLTYTSPPGAESMDYAFEIGIYCIFILFSFFGIISALTIHFSLKPIRISSIISSLLTNFLHLLSLFTMIYINRDFCIIFPILWFISLIITITILLKNYGEKL